MLIVKMPSMVQANKRGTSLRCPPDREPLDGWLSLHEEYDFIYRRLCAAVHHDHRLQALIEPLLGEHALGATMHAAVVATGVLLSSAAEPLHMPGAWVRGISLVATP